MLFWIFFSFWFVKRILVRNEIQTHILRASENNNTDKTNIKVSGPDTEIYEPVVWIRDLRTAGKPIRMQEVTQPYNTFLSTPTVS